jgi:ABC-type dipeptide/oligopeptide/nickel transport system permease subunit
VSSTPTISRPPGLLSLIARSRAGLIGLIFLGLMAAACLLTLPYTLGSRTVTVTRDDGKVESLSVPRYVDGDTRGANLPPTYFSLLTPSKEQIKQLNALVPDEVVTRRAKMLVSVAWEEPVPTPDEIRKMALEEPAGFAANLLADEWPTFLLGTDALGRSVLLRALAGGGISLLIGIAAATLSVGIGTLYGALAGYMGGRIDGVMMRLVDILYGLPSILLVILLAVASDALLSEYISRQKERGHWMSVEAAAVARERGLPDDSAEVAILLSQDTELDKQLRAKALDLMPPRRVEPATRMVYDIVILLVAIGGVSWLTMSRVIRGQVLSLKSQPFIEAARALGIPPWRIFLRHLLPNLTGPIIVYATLTVPQAILQESFLSFLGIGVKTPLPSWGNLAADGLPELNPYKSNWWLLVVPCVLLGSTLLSLNFVGEGLREALDPRRRAR